MRRFALALAFSLAALAPALACPTDPADAPYEQWNALLNAHVNADGLVAYAALAEDRDKLDQVVAAFAEIDPATLEGKALEAYWINVYNAVTLQQLVAHGPVKSIKDLAPAKDGFNVWEDKLFRDKSLNEIENQVLRPMGDPRIHAAINCASMGCPPLRAEAFLPSKLDAQLDDSVRRWLKDPKRGLKITGKVAHLSEIFFWFGGDFGADPAARLAWIERYVDEDTQAALSQPGLQLKELPWDWSLNKQ